MPLSPELENFLARFENLFQSWWNGEIEVRAMNEEIERVYRQRGLKTPPPTCRHGKTYLTCSTCYLNGFERGDLI